MLQTARTLPLLASLPCRTAPHTSVRLPHPGAICDACAAVVLAARSTRPVRGKMDLRQSAFPHLFLDPFPPGRFCPSLHTPSARVHTHTHTHTHLHTCWPHWDSSSALHEHSITHLLPASVSCLASLCRRGWYGVGMGLVWVTVSRMYVLTRGHNIYIFVCLGRPSSGGTTSFTSVQSRPDRSMTHTHQPEQHLPQPPRPRPCGTVAERFAVSHVTREGVIPAGDRRRRRTS